MTVQKDHEKQSRYAKTKAKLTRAIAGKYYFEAVLIEYALFEDRCESVLKHANVKYLNNKGYPVGLDTKLNKIRDNPVFYDKYVRKRIPCELIEEIKKWKAERDRLAHALLKRMPDETELEAIALEGRKLILVFENRVKSVNTYHDKKLLK